METRQLLAKVSLLLSCSLTLAQGEDKLAHVDLEKLRDQTTALEIIKPFVLPNENWQLTGYVLLEAPQRDDKPPLQILCAARDYISEYKVSEGYEIRDETALFGKELETISFRSEPTLDPILESVLIVFENKGDEIRPFGGNNYLGKGYLYDFDRDGILDRADSTNHGLKELPKYDIEVFALLSVESEPRTLLEVIFNWHPRSADDANEWSFECHDENADGIPEIVFGPLDVHEKLRPEITFRWDPESKIYTAGDLPKNAHVYVKQEGESLKSIAAKGSFDYPLIKGFENSPPNPTHLRDYVFESLSHRPVSELAAFFKGTQRRDIFDGPAGSLPNTLPKNLFSMPPKEAALALAEANRNPAHREQYRLALDDLNEISPPPSGWAQYDWRNSGSYSYTSSLYAVQFGTPDPVLAYFGYNSIGVVGRNPYADQPANNARLVKLSQKEATFLVETSFWLNRIRSKRLSLGQSRYSSMSSSADGYGGFSLHPENGKPVELASETDWATDSISSRWDGEYDRTVFVNLAGLLFRKGVPEMLGERWNTDNKIEGHSLTTSTEDRLADRIGNQAREELASDFSTILKINQTSPLPPEALARLCSAAGTEALISLLPKLKKLHASFPPPNDEDKEYEVLRKRFARDHFGNPLVDDPDDHPKDYARLNELYDKRMFDLAAVLRDSLESGISKIRLTSDSASLKKEVVNNGPLSQWALSQLLRTEPDTWATLISANFAKSNEAEKRTIFITLAAGHPPAAAQLIDDLKAEDQQSLLLEIARYQKKHAPKKFPKYFPSLIAFAADKKKDIYRRGDAMEILASDDLSEPQLRELTAILIAEVSNPQQGKISSGTLRYALNSLIALPNPGQHLEFILSLPNIAKIDFPAGFQTLEVMTRDKPERSKILGKFLRTQFTESDGMMNYHFAKALTYDLRMLAPEIAAFASENAKLEDGDGADYSGGSFISPVGHRYHIARDITALWTEKDPSTLARMWIAFAAARPSLFSDDDPKTSSLRERAEWHIRNLPVNDRRQAIQETLIALPLDKYQSATQTWLESLVD